MIKVFISIKVTQNADTVNWMACGDLVGKLTDPHRDGTIKSFGSLSVKAIKLLVDNVSKTHRRKAAAVAARAENISYSSAASDTGIRRLSKSSRSLAFSSVSRRSFSSAMLCFFVRPSPTGLISYGAAIASEGNVGGMCVFDEKDGLLSIILFSDDYLQVTQTSLGDQIANLR